VEQWKYHYPAPITRPSSLTGTFWALWKHDATDTLSHFVHTHTWPEVTPIPLVSPDHPRLRTVLLNKHHVLHHSDAVSVLTTQDFAALTPREPPLQSLRLREGTPWLLYPSMWCVTPAPIVSGAPCIIDSRRYREQGGMKWWLPKMKTATNPASLSKADDCVPWSGTSRTLNESALMIREILKKLSKSSAILN